MIGDHEEDYNPEDMAPGFGDDLLGPCAARAPGAFAAAKTAERKARRAPIPPSAKIPLAMAIAVGDPLTTTLAICVWQDYRSVDEPFDTPQELFGECGVSKQQKARALAELERRGIIVTVEHRLRDGRGNLLGVHREVATNARVQAEIPSSEEVAHT
jgi:hypothetical protein